MKIKYLPSPLQSARSGTELMIREIEVGEVCYPREYSSLEASNIAWEGREDGIWCIKKTDKYSPNKAPYMSCTWADAHNKDTITHNRTVVIE